MRAYHGTDNPDIEALEGYKPSLQYGGDIGGGVYVSQNFETAAFYGRYVYTLELSLTEADVFYLGPEEQYPVEGFEGTSVLIGESVPPFYFFLNGQKYLVGFDDDDIGAAQEAKKILIERLQEVYTGDLYETIANYISRVDSLPDVDDIADQLTLEDLADYLPENATDEAIEATAKEVASLAAGAIAEATDWESKNTALVISLDELGAEVEAAGYKAVYFERGGSAPDEILVFDPANVKIVDMVDSKSKKGTAMKHLTRAIQLAASHEDLNTWEEIFNKAVADGIAEIESGYFPFPDDIKAKIVQLARAEFLRIVGDPDELNKEIANPGPRQSLWGSIKDYVYDEAIGAARSETYYLLERIDREMGDGTYQDVLRKMEERGW